MSYTVLVVEDDDETRGYIADALGGEAGPYVVTTAATFAQSVELLEREPPDVLLVDLGLPDGNGLELIQRSRRLSADTLALVISVFGDESSVIRAIEAGARGYLLKSEAPEDLRLCVHQLLAGGAPISPGIAAHVLRRFREPAPVPEDGDEASDLTTRERQVLQLMVQGLTYKEAADTLGISRNTVASHIKHIYRKLEVDSRGEAVFEALSRGILKV